MNELIAPHGITMGQFRTKSMDERNKILGALDKTKSISAANVQKVFEHACNCGLFNSDEVAALTTKKQRLKALMLRILTE